MTWDTTPMETRLTLGLVCFDKSSCNWDKTGLIMSLLSPMSKRFVNVLVFLQSHTECPAYSNTKKVPYNSVSAQVKRQRK